MRRAANYALNALTAIVTLGAIGVTSVRMRRETPIAEMPPPTVVKDWRVYAAGDDRIGPASSRVVVTFFSDFECPFCQVAAIRLHALRQENPGQISIIYRHYPLSIHRHSRPAAVAAICASKQGSFEAYHDQLFSHQDSLGVIGWRQIAKLAHVRDLDAFDRCIVGDQARTVLQADSAAAVRLGVRGTPTMLINNLQVVGNPDPGVLERLVRDGLHLIQQK
jgi:protein-disulfide isomerase